MVTATVLVLIFAPLFFVLIEKLFGKRGKDKSAEPADSKPLGDR
jgi:peptidoglycan/LPS O-acetylase OafA/YrhL